MNFITLHIDYVALQQEPKIMQTFEELNYTARAEFGCRFYNKEMAAASEYSSSLSEVSRNIIGGTV